MRKRRLSPPIGPMPPTPPGARLLLGLFGFIFAGIGLTVIIFLWSEPSDSFGAPPLFFRIFGSFIAIAFMIFGGAMGVGSLKPGGKPGDDPAAWASAAQEQLREQADPPAAPGRYACPRCGAPLGEKADVSPMGDAKCIHCGSWFNIHGRSHA